MRMAGNSPELMKNVNPCTWGKKNEMWMWLKKENSTSEGCHYGLTNDQGTEKLLKATKMKKQMNCYIIIVMTTAECKWLDATGDIRRSWTDIIKRLSWNDSLLWIICPVNLKCRIKYIFFKAKTKRGFY